MRGRALALFTVLASLVALPALLFAQQAQSPWPPPAGAQQPPPAAWPDTQGQQQPPPPPAKKKTAKKKTPPAEPPDPRFEEEPPPNGAPPGPGPMPVPKRPKRVATAALDIKCDGPFAKNTTFANLVKVFGAPNVFSAGGPNTILFNKDPKRRIEITWGDVTTRTRPKMILVEAQSTWRVRGFRLGDSITEVEKMNGKPFTLVGFGGTPGGNARDWQGGKLDKLSGGCLLGMRFAAAAGTPQDVLSKVTVGGELTSNSPDVLAAKPTIIELIVGYPD
jgi:hypothetical protein